MINMARLVILNAAMDVEIHLAGSAEQHGEILCIRHVSSNAFSYVFPNPISVFAVFKSRLGEFGFGTNH